MGMLKDKVAVVTGGASGIGRAAVERFHREGACVILADILDETGESVAKALGERVRFIRCDVTKEADIAAAQDYAVKSFGGLDVLFNNAGAGGAPHGIEWITAEAFEATHRLLLTSCVLGIKHAIPKMRARGGGSIINTASLAGIRAATVVGYATAKAAVVHLAQIAAVECAPDMIRVNSIAPGLIATPIWGRAGGAATQAQAEQAGARVAELAKYGQPLPIAGLAEHVADAALFLASDMSAFITGQTIVVDGGISLRPGGGPVDAGGGMSAFAAALGMDAEQMAKARRGEI